MAQNPTDPNNVQRSCILCLSLSLSLPADEILELLINLLNPIRLLRLLLRYRLISEPESSLISLFVYVDESRGPKYVLSVTMNMNRSKCVKFAQELNFK